MGKTILHTNITPEIAQIALDSGLDINERSSEYLYYETPLAVAAMNNNLELVKFLIDKGADVSSIYLLPAPFSDIRIDYNIIDYIVQIGYPKTNKNLADDYPENQFKDIIALYGSDEQKNKLEIEFIEACLGLHFTKLYKGDINAHNSLLLFQAVRSNHCKWVKYLVDKGINKSVRDDRGKMPIEYTENKIIRGLLKD